MLKINNDDTVLTLTSGGCNSLNLLLHGAGHLVSVDCNPAQSALLELKATGIRCAMHVSCVRSCCYLIYICKRRVHDTCVSCWCRQLHFEDFWQLFGEGKHSDVEKLYERKLAPFLTQTSHRFWKDRLWYFKQGLYYQGGMVRNLPPD